MPRLPSAITVRRILGLLETSQRREVRAVMALIVIATLLEALSVGLVIPAIVLLTQSDLNGQPGFIRSLLGSLGIGSGRHFATGVAAVVAAYFVKAAFLAYLARRQTRLVHGVQADLSNRLFAIYLHQPWLFHLQRNSAQLIRNVINEVNLFSFNALQAGLTLVSESLVAASIGILLLLVEPVGTLALLLMLGGASCGFQRLTRARTATAAVLRQHHEGMRLQHLQQGLASVRELRLLGRENEFLKRSADHTAQASAAGRWLAMLQQLPRLWLELLAVAGFAALVICMSAQGRSPATMLPALGLFAAAAFRLLPSVQRLTTAKQALDFGLPAIELLHAEFANAAQAQATAREPCSPFCDRIELKQVGFSYPDAAGPALVDVSLVVRHGECVAVEGASGAGKTTLVLVLLGLIAVDSGEVQVDGHNLRRAMRNWQDQLGYVPQSISLIDDTIARNVAFGVPDDEIDREALWRALRVSQMEDFVHRLPQGPDTPLGERGIRLSGGQRQRIGFARALYRNPAVLILDEATSQLDITTERELMLAVRRQRERTIVMVAHHVSMVEQCDRRYRLEAGRMEITSPAGQIHGPVQGSAA